MTDLTAVVIGAGVISEHCHLPGYAAGGVRVAAVCDLDAARAERAARRFDVPRTYTDWREMLRAERPQVVSICTPNAFHAEQAVAALEAGAHVLCEKPAATSVAAAERMFAAARKADRILMVGQSHRFTPQGLAAKEIVESGRLGHVYHAETSVVSRLGIPGRGAFCSQELSGGGVLLDNGVHALDQALWLLGSPPALRVSAHVGRYFGDRPEVVRASGGSWDPERFDVDDFAVVYVSLDGGRSLILRSAWAAHIDEPAPLHTSLLGTDAGLSTAQMTLCSFTESGPVTEPIEVSPHSHYEREMAHWVAVIRGDAEPVVREHETLTVQRILAAAYASSSGAREVILT